MCAVGVQIGRFLSTLSLRRATIAGPVPRSGRIISIHALLAESDPLKNAITAAPQQISIHALLAESDLTDVSYLSIDNSISIHALLAESDPAAMLFTFLSFKFLSTLSLRRATTANRSDPSAILDFYPRSPCGERHLLNIPAGKSLPISIHALLAESDSHGVRIAKIDLAFLSTLSLRRATQPRSRKTGKPLLFLSTLSLRRATAKVHKTVGHFCAYGTNFMGISSSC